MGKSNSRQQPVVAFCGEENPDLQKSVNNLKKLPGFFQRFKTKLRDLFENFMKILDKKWDSIVKQARNVFGVVTHFKVHTFQHIVAVIIEASCKLEVGTLLDEFLELVGSSSSQLIVIVIAGTLIVSGVVGLYNLVLYCLGKRSGPKALRSFIDNTVATAVGNAAGFGAVVAVGFAFGPMGIFAGLAIQAFVGVTIAHITRHYIGRCTGKLIMNPEKEKFHVVEPDDLNIFKDDNANNSDVETEDFTILHDDDNEDSGLENSTNAILVGGSVVPKKKPSLSAPASWLIEDTDKLD